MKHAGKNLILLGGILLFFIHIQSVYAESEKSVYQLESIIVTAEKENKTVIETEDIERPSVSGSILDALRNTAGIQFLRTSANTGNDIRIRGVDESRFLVEMDGIPMNLDGSYGGDQMHWESISADQIEKIEIQEGAVYFKCHSAV